mgnify:CR=1 FL=1
MKKNFILTVVISALVASGVTAFASGPGEPFADVAEDAYYYDAVNQMRGIAVITGYDDGNFGPDDYVTRGQVATMFYRYDDALLIDPDNSAARVSGIQNLVTLLCGGVIDPSEADEYVQDAYDEICTGDGEW